MSEGPASKKVKMEHEEEDEDSVPEEIEEQCLECHHALADLEKLLKPLLTTPRALDEYSDLDNASLTLTLLYTINSLFWVYLTTQGVNPKTHSIRHELDRIQKYMQKANVISQRIKGEVPRINQKAAERFVKNALWDEEAKKEKINHK